MSIRDMYKPRRLEDYKIPEEIPSHCKECQYFKKTGIIDIYRGHCGYYDEDRFSNWKCIAHEYMNLAGQAESFNPKIIDHDIRSEKKDMPTRQRSVFGLPAGFVAVAAFSWYLSANWDKINQKTAGIFILAGIGIAVGTVVINRK